MKSRLAAKITAATFALSGLGIGMAGPAAAYSCATTKVESFALYYSNSNVKAGWLDRYDTAFSCPSNTAEEKKSYTRSGTYSSVTGSTWHKVTHSIYDMNTGAFLRSTTKEDVSTLVTTAIKNRTQGSYHYSGFLVRDHAGVRLYPQAI